MYANAGAIDESSLESTGAQDLIPVDFHSGMIQEESKEVLPGWYERGSLKQGHAKP